MTLARVDRVTFLRPRPAPAEWADAQTPLHHLTVTDHRAPDDQPKDDAKDQTDSVSRQLARGAQQADGPQEHLARRLWPPMPRARRRG